MDVDVAPRFTAALDAVPLAGKRWRFAHAFKGHSWLHQWVEAPESDGGLGIRLDSAPGMCDGDAVELWRNVADPRFPISKKRAAILARGVAAEDWAGAERAAAQRGAPGGMKGMRTRPCAKMKHAAFARRMEIGH
eukprot:gene18003-13064_t